MGGRLQRYVTVNIWRGELAWGKGLVGQVHAVRRVRWRCARGGLERLERRSEEAGEIKPDSHYLFLYKYELQASIYHLLNIYLLSIFAYQPYRSTCYLTISREDENLRHGVRAYVDDIRC
jgi:hypothetical protein